jgi:hypothetical protein
VPLRRGKNRVARKIDLAGAAGFAQLELLGCYPCSGQLRQHRIHVRLYAHKLIFKELHVALIEGCSLRHRCGRLH